MKWGEESCHATLNSQRFRRQMNSLDPSPKLSMLKQIVVDEEEEEYAGPWEEKEEGSRMKMRRLGTHPHIFNAQADCGR